MCIYLHVYVLTCIQMYVYIIFFFMRLRSLEISHEVTLFRPASEHITLPTPNFAISITIMSKKLMPK